MRLVLAAAALSIATGCAVSATQTKMMTLQPQKDPVVITAQCVGTSTDYMFVHTAKAALDLKASNGQQADQPKP